MSGICLLSVEMRISYKILVDNSEGKKIFVRRRSRPRPRWEII